jgi:hypothetical protein
VRENAAAFESYPAYRVNFDGAFRYRLIAEHHLPKPEARKLYEDRTPQPSPKELELKRLMRAAGFRPTTKAPDKRERRQLRRRKEERE